MKPKTATVADLLNNFRRVSAWLENGESVEIVKRGRRFERGPASGSAPSGFSTGTLTLASVASLAAASSTSRRNDLAIRRSAALSYSPIGRKASSSSRSLGVVMDYRRGPGRQ